MDTQSTTTETIADTHEATLGGEIVRFHSDNMSERLDALMARHPGEGTPSVRRLDVRERSPSGEEIATAERLRAVSPDAVAGFAVTDALGLSRLNGERVSQILVRHEEERRFSEFGAGGQIVDDGARVRIEAQHDTLKHAGVSDVGGRNQFFATGTRMARDGYVTQENRAREHEAKQPLREAAALLREAIVSEQREDTVLPASEIARKLSANGKIRFDGLALGEQAIRGILLWIGSPALSYVLGLRDRAAEASKAVRAIAIPEKEPEKAIAAKAMLKQQAHADVAKIVDVLAYELDRAADEPIKLRLRHGVGDVFAAVSPAYSPADAPEVIGAVIDGMPVDARASWAYDAASTAWEIRASIWTPTPVAEQAVGDAFEGYVSFSSRDNGTGSLRGGGGILMLRCLNASTYVAGSTDVNRRHVGRILLDAGAMLKGALAAIDALCEAWGRARAADATPLGPPNRDASGELDRRPIPIQQAIPGIYFGELLARDRRGELAGVLPGRSSEHVPGLTRAYFEERRDPDRIVRADIAQGWTRYAQSQPAPVRRDAEAAIGRWIAGSPIRFDAEKALSFAAES